MSNNESILYTATALNNEGVSSALAGDFQTGLASLSRSLSIIHNQIITSEGVTSSSSIDGNESCVKHIQTGGDGNGRHGAVYHAATIALPTLQESGSQSHFLYAKAVTLSSPLSNYCDMESVQVYSACVILNLAMLYHCLAIKNNNSFKLMNKADNLYKMVLNLLEGQSCYMHEDNKDDTVILVKLIALNNQASIKLELGCLDDAVRRTQEMAHLIKSSDFTRSTLFTEQEWDGFFLNIMLVANSLVTAAAA